MNCKKKTEELFFVFRENMKLLHDANEGFEFEILLEYFGTCTGCIWQTASTRNNLIGLVDLLAFM